MSLQLANIHVKIKDQEVVRGLDLVIKPGEIHALMGPNGSGKSSLAYSLAGHPEYQLLRKKDSQFSLDQKELWSLSADDRAKLGLFLAFQYPVEIPGVKVESFLRESYRLKHPEISALEFRQLLTNLAQKLQLKPDLIKRNLNEGFSGGEKKRLEILQLALLAPQYAILDETDSGLDIDAIKQVAMGVKQVVSKNKTGVLVITHYQRILDYLKPDFVHVMVMGKIVKSGGRELVAELEKNGYQSIKNF